jgi:hypothetical protein
MTPADPPGPAPGHRSAAAVPTLAVAVTGVTAERYAAVPTLRLGLAVQRTGGAPVRAVALDTVLRIDPARRRYAPAEVRALAELFGAPEGWSTALRPLAWTRATVQVPAFTDRVETGLAVECGPDAELAVAKYLRAVRDGSVPLDLQFSGAVFYEDPGGGLRTARLPWTTEARAELPAALWHEVVGRYHGDSPWLRLPRATYDRLDAYRAGRALGGWADAVRELLDRAGAPPGAADPDTLTEAGMPT